MKRLLVISLYDGNNELTLFDEEEYELIKGSTTKCTKGDRAVWMGEEHMYIEL